MSRGRAWALRVAGVAVFLLLWEVAGRMLGDALFAPFSAVISGFPATVRDYKLFSELAGSFQQLVLGYLLGCAVGIARALAIDPAVLLMDEPFGALDAQTREDMQDELLRIWAAERKTVLFVTHSIEEAIYLSDRVMIMTPRPGRMLAVFDVPFDRPRSESYRTLPEFSALRHDIHSRLKSAR